MSEAAAEPHEIVIEDLAYGGDGVGHLPSGKALFVPFTIPGERVRVEVLEEKKSYARGRCVEVLEASAERIAPPCPYFGSCGGCQYQHIADDAELGYKVQQLQATLRRLGQIEELPEIEPVVASPESYGYRNKVVLHPSGTTPPFGYHSVGGDQIVPITSCPIADPLIQETIADLGPDDRRDMPLTLRRAENGRIFRYYGRGPKRAPWLREHMHGTKVSVPLTAFAQINDAVAEAVIAWLEPQLAAAKPATLIDLYCGAGLFALTLGKHAKRLIGIERDRESIKAARFNAKNLGLKRATLTSGPVERVLPQVLRELEAPESTTVILDPPRGGCEKEVIQALAAWGPGRLIYVSCNPSSLARDLKRLRAAAPYALRQLALFDMFPQTAHFETVAILEPTGS